LQPVFAGVWRVDAAALGGGEAVATVVAGEVSAVELGVLGRLDLRAGPDAAWGTPVWIQREDREEGPMRRTMVGMSLHVSPGEWRVFLGRPTGEGERVPVRPGRVRRPVVVGRGYDALPPDETNLAGEVGTKIEV
jgi:hypothetical protein